MSWAIERDERGIPVRMWWMRQPPREPKVIPQTVCPHCGFHFGWHALGCAAIQHKGSEDAGR